MADITLTQAHKDQIPAWFEHWAKIGMCTEPADKPRAEAAIREIYKMRGLGEPRFVWVRSPLEAMKSVKNMVLSNSFRGSNDAYWVGLYRFCQEVVGKKYDAERTKHLHLWSEIAQSAYWWWPFERGVCISDRPRIMALDERMRSHSDAGPAIAFRDSFEIHCWHGVRVPKLVIEEPHKITADMIKKQSNQEIRRVMIQRFGGERFIKEFGCTKTHEDDYGVLYHGQDQGREIAYVKVVNGTAEPDGTYKDYFLCVRPESRTALAAVASTYRNAQNRPMSAEEYSRLLART